MNFCTDYCIFKKIRLISLWNDDDHVSGSNSNISSTNDLKLLNIPRFARHVQFGHNLKYSSRRIESESEVREQG